jgi:hypothetical protein
MSICSTFDEVNRFKRAEFDRKREHCATCRFWMPRQTISDDEKSSTDELGFGFCRRQPPKLIEHLVAMVVAKPVLGKQSDIDDLFDATDHFDATAFPGTYHSEWCGEFQWLPKLQPEEFTSPC